MSQELTVQRQGAVYKPRKFDEQEIAILRSSFAKQLDPMEFKVYVSTAQHLGLDPFSKEIYCLKYGTHPMTLITSIGGYRRMSARSGLYRGLTEPTLLVRTEQGQTVTVPHSQYDPEAHTEIISATIGIRVEGYPEPVYGTAVWKSHAKKVNGRLTDAWANMGDIMIIKCAEASAHRKAGLFPDGAAAVYVEGEIVDYQGPSGNVIDVTPVSQQIQSPPPPKPEPKKKTTPKPTKDEDIPPTEQAELIPEDVPGIMDTIAKFEKYLKETRKISDDGWTFALERIKGEFGVDNLEDIQDVLACQKFCKTALLEELKQESFLPLQMNS